MWELWVALGGIIFTAGGLVTWAKIKVSHLEKTHEADMSRLDKKVEIIESRVNTHEEHFARHDVVFENIVVNQKYMIKGIDDLKEEMSELRKKQSQP